MISDYYHLTMSVELAALLHNISYFILISSNLLFASFVYISYPTVYIMDFSISKFYGLEKGQFILGGHNAYEMTFAHKVLAKISRFFAITFFRLDGSERGNQISNRFEIRYLIVNRI